MNPERKSKIIVVTGAESTGKSTLTQQLAEKFQVPYHPEFARGYIEKLNRHYTSEDVEIIARYQQNQLLNAMNSPDKFVFLDTWLIITKVWLEIVFAQVPEWISVAIKQSPVDLFLVCDTDIPWISDPVRENGGEMREKLSHLYIENITSFGFPYKIISGAGSERLENAIQFVNQI